MSQKQTSVCQAVLASFAKTSRFLFQKMTIVIILKITEFGENWWNRF